MRVRNFADLAPAGKRIFKIEPTTFHQRILAPSPQRVATCPTPTLPSILDAMISETSHSRSYIVTGFRNNGVDFNYGSFNPPREYFATIRL
jgi:hypothetical protein